ncbi:MAG: hypothetical protein ACPLSK_02225, partial [bacterium]
KKESKIKRGEFKQGIGRVWWHRGLRGFCIVAFNKILLLKETSEVETLLSLEELDWFLYKKGFVAGIGKK